MRLPGAVGRFNQAGDRWTKESRLWIPEIDAQHRIRIERLKSELDLEERARSDARNQQPAADDALLNEAQLDVCNRVFSGILMLNQFLAEQLGTVIDAARRALPERVGRDDYIKRIEIEANTIFAEFRGPLRQLRRRQLQADRDLRYFRNANNLNRGASYKESHVLVAGILVALFVLESVANGMLFRDIVRGGWLGGVFLAALVSALNVVSGLIAGIYGWSYVGHIKLWKKAIGVSVVAVCHVGALYWNLMVAHFREVAESAAQNPDYDFNIFLLAEAAWRHIDATGWFGLITIYAWALFGLGMLIHFLAAREGWDDIGDRYPDYMKTDRAARESEVAFDDALVEMRSAARSAAEAVIHDAEEKAGRGRARLNAIADLENLARQREQEVRDSEKEWVTGGTRLLRTYRDINLDVRGAVPPPAYFESYPTPDEYRRSRFGAGLAEEADIDRHVEAVERARAEIGTLLVTAEAVVAANEETITALRAEVNRVLADLDQRVDSAEVKATAAAKDATEDLAEAAQ
jgi:hypothetical protein